MAKLHFIEEDKTIDIQVGQNILEAALENEIDLDHACGGVCACSTCHVKIREGFDLFPEAEEEEEDQLDDARDIELSSRLACQCTLQKETDQVIEVGIPFWNVNLVAEGPDAAHEAH
ncbi:MAG: 2Fe-2S iron-sulfur cluster-binding protein [bacterium]